MVKMDPETQVHTVTGPSFLSLPLELRNIIYRLLLVSDKPLGTKTYSVSEWASFGRYDLHPAILRVCSQVCQEASPILNSENTFGIYISGDKDIIGDEDLSEYGDISDSEDSSEDEDISRDEYIIGDKDRHLVSYTDDKWDELMREEFSLSAHHEAGWIDDRKTTTEFMNFPLNMKSGGLGPFRERVSGFEGNDIIRRFQRLEILMTFADPRAIRLHAEVLCVAILRKMPVLRHVCIRVANDTSDTNNTALGPFGMLRNMRSVVIHGAPLPLAERLRSLMLGNTPCGNVELMYLVLQDFVRSMNGNRYHLLKAYLAMLDWDVEKFKEFRSKILAESEDRRDLLLRHMYDYDVKSEQDHQAKIEENDVGNVGENRDERPGDP